MLPIFFIVLIGFLFYFQLMTVQLRISSGLDAAGQNIATVYHLENVIPGIFSSEETDDDSGVIDTIKTYAGKLLETGVTSAYVKYELTEYVGEDFLDRSCISGGSDGLVCYAAVDSGTLDIRAIYKVSIPLLPQKLFSFSVTQRLTRHIWVGISVDTAETDDEDSDEKETEAVYITKYGTVYHLYKDCSALKRSIKTCAYANIDGQTNSSGSHYSACELCIHGSVNAIVYITTDGTKYHNSSSCPSLVRYIEEISISEVGDKGLCSYCKKRQEAEGDDSG